MTKTILVVEDDPDISTALRIRLRAAGYEVLQAHDGLQGLLSCVNRRPDCLLLDISLPAGDGFSVVERLRLHPHLSTTPFIMITASRRPELRTRALALGAAAFIEKPYDSRELLAAIGEAVSGPALSA